MRELLFLAHRFPYPPDKGERIRAWHLLRHLAGSWRVRLGCLEPEPIDPARLAAVRAICGEVAVFRIRPGLQKLRALAGWRPGRPLMLDYYRHGGLQRWVNCHLADGGTELAYAFSTPMAQYLPPGTVPVVLDMVDVDSEKWAAYAADAGWPMRAVWAREARTLRAFEVQATMASRRALLVSEAEVQRFAALAPETAGHVHALPNGVDLDAFTPAAAGPSPFPDPAPRIVFTGHMDYWPNADAAIWFAREVLPRLAGRAPPPRFVVVGANPGPAVRALADLPGVSVTGRVADVRPYVGHAAVVVAPLRIARGIQNKVLEAMAMGRPVVATPQAFEGIAAAAGRDLLVGADAAGLAAAAGEVLDGSHPLLGARARAAVEARYAWDGVFARLDRLLGDALRPPACLNPRTQPA